MYWRLQGTMGNTSVMALQPCLEALCGLMGYMAGDLPPPRKVAGHRAQWEHLVHPDHTQHLRTEPEEEEEAEDKETSCSHCRMVRGTRVIFFWFLFCSYSLLPTFSFFSSYVYFQLRFDLLRFFWSLLNNLFPSIFYCTLSFVILLYTLYFHLFL